MLPHQKGGNVSTLGVASQIMNEESPRAHQWRDIWIWLISIYWFARSGGVPYMWHIAQTDPARASRAVEYINFFGPLLWILRLRSNLAISAAPFSALVAIGIGVGLLLYQKWALTIALIDRIIPFIKLVIFTPLAYGVDRGE